VQEKLCLKSLKSSSTTSSNQMAAVLIIPEIHHSLMSQSHNHGHRQQYDAMYTAPYQRSTAQDLYHDQSRLLHAVVAHAAPLVPVAVPSNSIPLPSPPRPSNRGNMKQVLPCFNMICTGTCAYGLRCTFLHDPRSQIPKNVRRATEFLLQSHLHTFRPYGRSALTGAATTTPQTVIPSVASVSTDHEASDTDNSSVGSGGGNNSRHVPYYSKSKGFKRDDIFDFPCMEIPRNEPNSKCYDPASNEFAPHSMADMSEYWRELSMWYHLLAVVNTEKVGLERIPLIPSACQKKRKVVQRLPIFEQLAQHGKLQGNQVSDLW
jgi:hypothetical protein